MPITSLWDFNYGLLRCLKNETGKRASKEYQKSESNGGIGMKRYIVRLTTEEHKQLEDIVSKGKSAAYKIKHAHILLSADAEGENLPDEEIAKALHCHRNTVFNVRQRFVEKGLETALERKKQEMPSVAKMLDGEKEAKLIAIGCSQPPEGCARWTLKLLADRMVELEIVGSISYETVRRTLKKTN